MSVSLRLPRAVYRLWVLLMQIYSAHPNFSPNVTLRVPLVKSQYTRLSTLPKSSLAEQLVVDQLKNRKAITGSLVRYGLMWSC